MDKSMDAVRDPKAVYQDKTCLLFAVRPCRLLSLLRVFVGVIAGKCCRSQSECTHSPGQQLLVGSPDGAEVLSTHLAAH